MKIYGHPRYEMRSVLAVGRSSRVTVVQCQRSQTSSSSLTSFL